MAGQPEELFREVGDQRAEDWPLENLGKAQPPAPQASAAHLVARLQLQRQARYSRKLGTKSSCSHCQDYSAARLAADTANTLAPSKLLVLTLATLQLLFFPSLGEGLFDFKRGTRSRTPHNPWSAQAQMIGAP